MPLPPDRPEQVQQTVVAFPTPEQAQALLTRVQGQWQSCAADKVSYRVPGTNGEVGWGYDFGKVQLRGDVLTVSMGAPWRGATVHAEQHSVLARNVRGRV